MYFVQKEGVYYGIFWHGDSEEDGRKKTDDLAKLDSDDYHAWVLYRFVEQSDATQDPEHELIYKTTNVTGEPRRK